MKEQIVWRDLGRALFLGTLLACSGCLTPINPQPGPAPGPQPTGELSRAVAVSVADVPRGESVKLFGVFTALASYVEDGGNGVESTSQLLQLTTATLDNLNWAKGRYPAVRHVVRDALNARFREPKPLEQARGEVVSTFREIAAGCRGGR